MWNGGLITNGEIPVVQLNAVLCAVVAESLHGCLQKADSAVIAEKSNVAVEFLNALGFGMPRYLARRFGYDVLPAETPAGKVLSGGAQLGGFVAGPARIAGKLIGQTIKRITAEELKPEGLVVEEPKIVAKFTKNDELPKSTWTLFKGDEKLLEASLEQIWEDELKDNMDWATSEEYGKDLAARFEDLGVDKQY